MAMWKKVRLIESIIYIYPNVFHLMNTRVDKHMQKVRKYILDSDQYDTIYRNVRKACLLSLVNAMKSDNVQEELYRFDNCLKSSVVK